MRVLILVAVCLFVGSCAGAKVAGEPETKTEFVQMPGKTKVIVEKEKGDTVYVMPDSCIRALEMADEMVRNAEDMYDFGTEQLQIISDTRMALADGGDLATIENRQRKLQGKMVRNLSDAEEAYYKYGLAYNECKEDMK